ncbi:site-specific integrase [Sphingobium sp. BYY-5]|uniref:tyrosine-type recombinase/integrase n=1 Tax=Sphingobium sp. BYY-5 TaxID=2926400 RepID=UPI001FA7BCD2|nr:tyrosine-type recombinase/integrase [Sphingobium sp. BYY-5]MCI4589269.1 site-specific integrase [Sphingobium sp. BYY-5]
MREIRKCQRSDQKTAPNHVQNQKQGRAKVKFMKYNVNVCYKIVNSVSTMSERHFDNRENGNLPYVKEHKMEVNVPWSMHDRGGQRKYLTNNETVSFLSVAKSESIDVYSFCWFLAVTGCRISEALSIGVESIDFSSGHVIIKCLKKRHSAIFRAVPLPLKMLDRLQEWVRKGKLSKDGRFWPWSRMTAYRKVTGVMEKARISGPWAVPKGLRHAFGVRAIHSGVPLNLVQRWLGHADMKTTAIYANASGSEEREIAARAWLSEDSTYELKRAAA